MSGPSRRLLIRMEYCEMLVPLVHILHSLVSYEYELDIKLSKVVFTATKSNVFYKHKICMQIYYPICIH